MRIFLLTLALFASGCASSPGSLTALCTATATDRQAHAAALVQDGGPLSQRTGVAVLSKTAAGCGE